jgi:hypothetical protein
MWLIRRYEDLSLDPFRRSDYSHRILAPLLGHVLHLDGDRFRLLTLGSSVLFLAGIYFYCRRAGVLAGGSFLVTLAFAMSRAVGNSNLFPGLTDTLSYLLLLLSMFVTGRPLLFWTLFALNLLNHEQIAFLVPWLLVVRSTSGARAWRADVAAILVVLGLYALLRRSLGSGVVALHAAYTLRPWLDYAAEYGMVWWFLWTSFGFLLAVLFWHGSGARRDAGSALLCVACAAAPYVMAWDPYRYIHLSFPVFLMAAVRFLKGPGRTAVFACLVAGNALIYVLSNWIMDIAVARIGAACTGAEDPVSCIHHATLTVTLPSGAVLLLMWAVAKRWAPARVRTASELSEEDQRRLTVP